MRGPRFHVVFLLVALTAAYLTYNRDRSAKPTARASVTVWDGVPADIEAVDFATPQKVAHVERRGVGKEAYLWGRWTRMPPPAPKPAANTPDAGSDEGMAADDAPASQPTAKETTREFPVGEAGDKALEHLAPLKAIRDLGVDTAQGDQYGLQNSKNKLTVRFHSGPRELIVGERVVGGGDRYVLDPTNKHVLVVAGEVVSSFETADSSLRESKLHVYPAGDVKKVLVKGPAPVKERTLVRTGEVTASGGTAPGSASSWADAAAPDKPDQTLANVMGRIDRLAATEYKADVDRSALTLVAHLEYMTESGTALGHLDLYKKAGATPEATEYLLETERTRVLATVRKLEAERVDQDLAQILAP